jgi:type VI secretion system protein ImpF
MASVNREMYFIPSILDRLLDEDLEAKQESPYNRFQSFTQLKEQVARDLEAMLNSRQQALEEVSAEFTEVSRSLLTYGLPDILSLNVLNEHDRYRLRRALELAITTFEPRLERVRVTLIPPQQYERRLHFRVEALLLVKPAPEPVVFDTMLQLNTQKYEVRG